MWDDPLMDDGDARDLRNITGGVAFVGVWIGSTLFGGLLGFLLGWLPAIILAPVAWRLAPLLWLALLIGGVWWMFAAAG